MNNYSIQQEVLLMTGSYFASRQHIERDTTENSKSLPPNENLKEACWNGLLRKMLPEIFLLSDPNSKLYLWQVREICQCFILEMGEYPVVVNKNWSIDPYHFLEVFEYN